MSRPPIPHFYQNIRPSFFSFEDFYKYAVSRMKFTGNNAVEVGVHTGASAAFLGVEMWNRLERPRLDLVDSMLPADIVDKYLAPIGDIIGWQLCEKSVDAAAFYDDASLDLVYIDADHARVAEDITAWLPKLRPGGLLAGHDFTPDMLPDGPQVIRDVIAAFPIFEVWRGSLLDGHYYPTWVVSV